MMANELNGICNEHELEVVQEGENNELILNTKHTTASSIRPITGRFQLNTDNDNSDNDFTTFESMEINSNANELTDNFEFNDNGGQDNTIDNNNNKLSMLISGANNNTNTVNERMTRMILNSNNNINNDNDNIVININDSIDCNEDVILNEKKLDGQGQDIRSNSNKRIMKQSFDINGIEAWYATMTSNSAQLNNNDDDNNDDNNNNGQENDKMDLDDSKDKASQSPLNALEQPKELMKNHHHQHRNYHPHHIYGHHNNNNNRHNNNNHHHHHHNRHNHNINHYYHRNHHNHLHHVQFHFHRQNYHLLLHNNYHNHQHNNSNHHHHHQHNYHNSLQSSSSDSNVSKRKNGLVPMNYFYHIQRNHNHHHSNNRQSANSFTKPLGKSVSVFAFFFSNLF